MNPFEIRRIEAADVLATTQMWRRSRDDVQPELEARMGHTADDDLNFFKDVLMKNCAIWVAVADGRPIGLMAMKENSIEQLYVDPSEQTQGVGSALMDLAKRSFPNGLVLYTHVSNQRARDFYEKRAFRAVEFGVSPAPESLPDVRYVWDGERSGEA